MLEVGQQGEQRTPGQCKRTADAQLQTCFASGIVSCMVPGFSFFKRFNIFTQNLSLPMFPYNYSNG